MDGHCYFKKKKNQKIILNHKQPASFQFPRRLLNDEGNISACFFFFFFISTPIQKVFISALFFFPNAIQWNSEFTGVILQQRQHTKWALHTVQASRRKIFWKNTANMTIQKTKLNNINKKKIIIIKKERVHDYFPPTLRCWQSAYCVETWAGDHLSTCRRTNIKNWERGAREERRGRWFREHHSSSLSDVCQPLGGEHR